MKIIWDIDSLGFPIEWFIAGNNCSSRYSIKECVHVDLSSGFLKIQLASTASLDIAEMTE